MSAEERSTLASNMTSVDVPAGGTVLRRGEPNDALFVLVSGRFRTTMEVGSETVVLGEATEGSFCGEAGLIDGGLSKVTVSTDEPSVFLRLSKEAVGHLRATQPRLLTLLLRSLCEDLASRLRTSRTVLRRAHDQTLRLYATAPLAQFNAQSDEDGGPRKGLLDSLKSLFGLGAKGSD